MDDVINRVDAIDAVLGIGHTAKLNDGDTVVRMSAVNYVLRNLPSAQPESEERKAESAQNVPKEDLISRKAAIDTLGERPMVWTDDDQYALGERNQYDMNRLAIETLPSAQPEPHYCRECKWSRCHINVDKYGNTETYWHCLNWDGGTDEEGYCYEWERKTDE